MFTILFETTRYTPLTAQVELRTSIGGWSAATALKGDYDAEARVWRWELPVATWGAGFAAKLFAEPFGWQTGANLVFVDGMTAAPGDRFAVVDGATCRLADFEVGFPGATGPVVESGWVQHLLFDSRPDPSVTYDVIVIGSGMAGGTVADHLADAGLRASA